MQEFTFTWRIENYSYCWHEPEENLISPAFAGLEGTCWSLSLFPKGFSDDCIGFYLCRSSDDEGPERFAVSFELQFLADDGSLLRSSRKYDESVEFLKGDGFGEAQFIKQVEVLLHKIDTYLPGDTLTTRCRLWKDSGDITQAGQCSARTRIGVERMSFVQEVVGFSTLQLNQKKKVQNRSNHEPKSLISASVYSTDTSGSKERVMFQITSDKKDKIAIFTYDLHLLDAAGNRIECGRADFRLDPSRIHTLNLPLIFSRDELVDKKIQYLPNNVLRLLCEISLSTRSETKEIERSDFGMHLMRRVKPDVQKVASSQNALGVFGCPSAPDEQILSVGSLKTGLVPKCPLQSMSNSATNLPAAAVELDHGCPSALDDFRTLFSDRFLSDVSLRTDTESFPAHKAVLCARSPVFRAMFANEMKEKTSDCIEVEDLEDDILRRFLLFLYSEAFGDVPWQTASKLYYAADKYQVKGLKKKCSSVLMDSLDVSNVCEILLLADMHQDLALKGVVEDFIFGHDEIIFSSDEWDSFSESHPSLALQTMRSKYRSKQP